MSTKNEFERQVQAELVKIRSEMYQPSFVDDDAVTIWNKVTESIARSIVDKGWSDVRDFSGVSRSKEKLAYFLAGTRYTMLGTKGLPAEYAGILQQHKKEQDSDYQTYLKLKEKFEGGAK